MAASGILRAAGKGWSLLFGLFIFTAGSVGGCHNLGEPAGCDNDFDCKGDRICDADSLRCVDARQITPSGGGGDPQTGSAQGGMAQGGMAQGGSAQGGMAQSGSAQGGMAASATQTNASQSSSGAGGALPAPVDLGGGWLSINLGDSIALGGYATRNGDAFEVFGGGGDIWGTTDHGHFVYQQVSGDFDLEITLVGFQRASNIADTAKAVLLFKEQQSGVTVPTSTDAGVFQSINFGFGDFWYHRPAAGADVAFDNQTSNLGVASARLRIERAGNVFSTYSRDQADTVWVKHNQDRTVPLSTNGFVGFAATSNAEHLMQISVTLALP